mmetsp:Transcript_15924/g.30552  ORF Transcript_15924/g.30552 Transcript_15924/m.30552 type:complete len:426 (+) Transcript_15924:354-1631(+)
MGDLPSDGDLSSLAAAAAVLRSLLDIDDSSDGHGLSSHDSDSRPFQGKQEEFYDACSCMMLMYSSFALFSATLIPNVMATVGLYFMGALLGMVVAYRLDYDDWKEPLVMVICSVAVGSLSYLDKPKPVDPDPVVDEDEEERRREAEAAMIPEERKALKEARRAHRRRRRRQKILASLSGEWGYIPVWTIRLFAGASFCILGVLCIDIMGFFNAPAFPLQNETLVGGFFLAGVAVGYWLEYDSVPLSACISGAYFVVATLDWCGYRYEYDDDAVFWPTQWLTMDKSMREVRSGWSVGVGITFVLFMVLGYFVQKFLLRDPVRESLDKERRRIEEGDEMTNLGADVEHYNLDETQLLQVTNLRMKLSSEQQLLEFNRDQMRLARKQMKIAMKKTGLDPGVEDYRKLEAVKEKKSGYGSFMNMFRSKS